MSTVSLNPKTVARKWWVIDAKGKVMGRLASQAARLLTGKHKKEFDTHHDMGDYVIVINADHIRFTGNKMNDMRYFQHSMYPGGWRNLTYAQAKVKRPELPVRHAIWGMLSHHRMGRRQITKLYIYGGEKHPHMAQKPEPFAV
jgi:large subunit ribosomal protein L13